MSDDKQTIKLDRAKGVIFQHFTGSLTAIAFRTDSGVFGAVLERGQLSLLHSLLIKEAIKIAAIAPPEGDPTNVTADPVPASGMSVADAKDPGQIVLTFDIGNLSMVFSVDEAMFRRVCARVVGPDVNAPPSGAEH